MLYQASPSMHNPENRRQLYTSFYYLLLTGTDIRKNTRIILRKFYRLDWLIIIDCISVLSARINIQIYLVPMTNELYLKIGTHQIVWYDSKYSNFIYLTTRLKNKHIPEIKKTIGINYTIISLYFYNSNYIHFVG